MTNAESQDLAFIHYRELVQRESNDEVFHDQTGYWLWDKDAGLVIHSFVIPRAVAVMAGGRFEDSPDAFGPLVLNVRAAVDDPDWQIIQSPFMDRKAKTLESGKPLRSITEPWDTRKRQSWISTENVSSTRTIMN